MDEIIPGLWIGNLQSASDVQTLKANNIFSILSAMRGKISIHETFIKHQLLLDDTEEADILQHFLPSISFIQAELSKGRGVLVHCQAGISRSVAIVAAYLMYDRHLTPDEALDLIRKARPSVDPNPGFLLQLEIFHNASYKISGRDKNTRMWYLDRTVDEVLNGDGSIPSTDMFAKFPQTPSASTPATPGGNRGPRRRIRCKMCRQELAAREHMLDHGQIGPATPASITPAASRRPSTNAPASQLSRNPSLSMTPANLATSTSRHPSMSRPRVGSSSDTRPRRPSGLGMGALSMSTLDGEKESSEPKDKESTSAESSADSTSERRLSGSDCRASGSRSSGLRPFQNLTRTMMDSLSMSALETEDEESDDENTPKRRHGVDGSADKSIQLGRRLSDAMIATSPAVSPSTDTTEAASSPPIAKPNADGDSDPPLQAPHFASPTDLAAQLNANPKLAALKSPVSITPSGITPLQTQGLGSTNQASAAPSPISRIAMPPSAPILINPKCSGYFVEPMKWMEPFLEEGQIAGKIMCPNKKCGAKLGNYDWAGVCCGCKEWVVPGFCINRSKVDEVKGNCIECGAIDTVLQPKGKCGKCYRKTKEKDGRMRRMQEADANSSKGQVPHVLCYDRTRVRDYCKYL
uniref:protein-tyrosine-phosphatase n=1 Tax=Moniliophthora roreri TaxID=221103 RepID=A0A0W0FZG5_MONRR